MTDEYYLCIHGHFYQPPRENPWFEAIEMQESAAPFHDWNERIFHECYLPNTMARVLDDKGTILRIVNNFEKISFNFGPTLISWMAYKDPDTYHHMIDADHASRKEFGGHGNAIAQVYNHMIMPLANRRDKMTQVRWGLADFRFRFGRDPESIWLPETACNEETLEVLVEHGIRFIILEPHQAEAVRPLGGHDWQDVSSGTINPKVPYRYFLKKDPDQFIDIFFYDGPISKELGFGPLAFDAKLFAASLESAKVQGHGPQLIHMATDGETYGHHKAFGERALAYLVNLEAKKRGFQLTNYAWFLEKFPPRFAVRLKEGETGEGTSWSCVHGVKRWKDHCGCRAGGPMEWTQYWRKPLRQALDWLRDEMAVVYETEGVKFFKDVWQARDAYVDVILDRSESRVAAFLTQHATRPLSAEERVTALKLLESQRHAMLMYTSCGWFFTELSGIETIQVIEYAARTIQLAAEVGGKNLEPEFVNRLAEAKSNAPEFKDGRGVYERFVKPHVIGLPHIISYYAISSLVDDFYSERETLRVYSYRLHVLSSRKESFGNLTMNLGRVQIRSEVTEEEGDFIFSTLQIGLFDFHCVVKRFETQAEFESLEAGLFESLHRLHFVELIKQMSAIFGEIYYTLKDLPLVERRRIISILTREVIEKISDVYENLYEENRRMNEIYRAINLPIPPEIRYAVQHTLEKRLKSAVAELADRGFDLRKAAAINRIIESARSFEVPIRKKEVAEFLSKELEKRTRRIFLNPSGSHALVSECLQIQKLAKKIEVEIDLTSSQNHIFYLLKKWHEQPETLSETTPEKIANVEQLLAFLRLNPDFKPAIRKMTERHAL